MDIRLYIYEDDDYERFYPLTYNRPVFQLLCGAFPIWQKWQYYFPQAKIRFLCRNEIAPFVHEQTGIECNRLDFDTCDKAIFVNGRVLPDEDLTEKLASVKSDILGVTDGNLSYAVVTSQSPHSKNLSRLEYWGYGHFKAILKDLPKENIQSNWLNYIWDFIIQNSEQIKQDWKLINRDSSKFKASPEKLPELGCWIYKPELIALTESSSIDSQTVLDARSGPIIIDENAYIAPHSRIEGPCYIGSDSQIVGGKIRAGCSLGPCCRVGGELENSIFLGFSNKYHDGFIGHAYLGEWVNLGAMTTNSDLKNNYGTIRVDNGSGQVDSGHIKVGSFIGDHVKTGIGMLLNTGISIGFASNLFGGGLIADKFIPPLVWGGPAGFAEYKLEKALQTAAVVMERRGRKLTDCGKALFKFIAEQSAESRENFIKKLD